MDQTIAINIVLTEQESASLIGLLGQLPTSSGVFPLVVKMTQMHNEQVQAAKEAAEAVEAGTAE